ncbi:hypothetical protein ACED29_09465 [Shewanella sp. 5S214]|uniref:hypothetical protein n=1 Tax=Shewanella sp. 5S214 TaxID=3229999 RepID=UPI00352E9243
MLKLEEKGLQCISIGLFDGWKNFFVLIYQMWKSKKVFSSNMKSNVFSLLFFWKYGVVLVNGMGRHRGRKSFRFFLLILFRINWKKRIIFQNYYDFRYYRKFSSSSIYWVPGSGGSIREVGCSSLDIIVVSRNDKLPIISKAIIDYAGTVSDKVRFQVIGCDDFSVSSIFDSSTQVIGLGFIPQDDIFKSSSYFFQPYGYGEGVPHTLVDAIVSKMNIIISKRDYIGFGLAKLDFKYSVLNGKWVSLEYDIAHANLLEENVILSKYIEIINIH